jgi:hypothetical protein
MIAVVGLLAGSDKAAASSTSIESPAGLDTALASPLAVQNPDGTYSETVGSNANTWTDYTGAGGSQGPTIPAFETVEIACVVQGFRVQETAWTEALVLAVDHGRRVVGAFAGRRVRCGAACR